MRTALRNSDEVFHYWANQVQAEGRAGNVFFRGAEVFSYGMHFCIARILPSGVVSFTTRDYSPTTTGHKSQARNAVRDRTLVYCRDPRDGARANMTAARHAIRDALASADKPRIRQTTREGHKARALQLAEQANAYLAALPEDERGTETPIDTTALEAVRASLVAAEEAAVRIRAEQHAAHLADLKESLGKWRTGEIAVRTGLYQLPVALRLAKSQGTHDTGGLLPDAGSVGRDVIETSHGAEIPVPFARRLWPLVLKVRDSGIAWQSPPEKAFPLGVYTLRTIRGDGSIVVGCHDIPFSELESMAQQLGLSETVGA